MSVFSLKFKELRTESSLSQNELARSLQYTQSNICEWEKGTVEPRASALLAIADFFQVSTDYLLGRTDDFGNLVNSNPSIANKHPSDLSGNRDKYLVDFEKYFKLLTEIQKAQVIGYVMGLLEQNGIKVNTKK